MARAASVAHRDLKGRIDSLASVAASAALLGFLGTALGAMTAFRGTSGDKITIMKAIIGELSEALLPTALGLLVSLFAFGLYRYLSGRLESFDTEMALAIQAELRVFRTAHHFDLQVGSGAVLGEEGVDGF
jgi:biopolymer transport protein ExbB/TolQ